MWLKKTIILLLAILTPMLFIITCLYNPFAAIGGDTNASASSSSSNILYQYDFSDVNGTTPAGWDINTFSYSNPPLFECTSDGYGTITGIIPSGSYGFTDTYYTPGISWPSNYIYTFTYKSNSGTPGGVLVFGVCFIDSSHYYRFTKNKFANALVPDLTGDNATWTINKNDTWNNPPLIDGDKVSTIISNGKIQVKLNETLKFEAILTSGTQLMNGSIELRSGTSWVSGDTISYTIDNILVTTP